MTLRKKFCYYKISPLSLHQSCNQSFICQTSLDKLLNTHCSTITGETLKVRFHKKKQREERGEKREIERKREKKREKERKGKRNREKERRQKNREKEREREGKREKKKREK